MDTRAHRTILRLALLLAIAGAGGEQAPATARAFFRDVTQLIQAHDRAARPAPVITTGARG